jgi:EAL domain-containing protein (putative c-di-GMP-specific phosphodiesterase class I)
MVEEGVVASGGRADLLELEITESVIMQHRQRTADAMNAFSRLGVRLAIDDFGTGYSSLGYLRKFPIDTLKIDQSFVRDIMDDDDDASITAAIIVMAHSLKLDVIAEGVESREQMEYLRLHGCSAMQGFLFSRPLPPEEVTQLLTSQYHAGWPVLPPRSS